MPQIEFMWSGEYIVYLELPLLWEFKSANKRQINRMLQLDG